MNYPIARKSRFERNQQGRWNKRRSQSMLERTARSTAIGAGALALTGLAATTAKGSTTLINVSHIQDVVSSAPVSRTYETYDLKVDGQDPQALVLAFAYRYPTPKEILKYPSLQSDSKIFIGGLENLPDNPFLPMTYGVGFMNKDDTTHWGLENYGDILGGNVPGGFFGFYDKNVYGEEGYGRIGTFNTETGVLTADAGEVYPIVSFSRFQPFPQSGTATIDSINLPEPATGAFLALGIVASIVAKKVGKYFSK